MSSAHRHPRLRGPRLFVLLGALLVAIPTSLFAAGPIAATERTANPGSGGTIPPGVHVGSTDLSGLDEATARQVIANAYAYLGQGNVTVTAGTGNSTISYASINRRIDVDDLIAQAFAVGRNGNAFVELAQFVMTVAGGTSLTPHVLFDEAGLDQQMATIAASTGTGPVNARVFRTQTGFSTTPAQAGRVWDTSTVLPQLTAQLYDVNAPPEVGLVLTTITDQQPAITDEQAQMARAAAAAMSLSIVLANDGDTWTIPDNVVHSWINFAVVGGTTIQIVFSDALIQKYLTTLAPKINRDPVSASWAFSVNGVVVVPSKDGRALDVARTSRRLQVFLQGRGAGTISLDKKIGPTVVTKPPALTTAQAQAESAKFQLLSTWTTYFQPAGHNGFGANIWVPAGYLDNQVVQPGQTFSFWDRVGPVTLARGYKLGGAIVGGHTEEGVAIGGGICSTSTTLFNAALRAGLQMGERSNHYYYITRYPVGLDATVSKTSGGGQQDMTFTNDTKYPILIKSFKTGGSVSFSLYGIPTGRTVTFSKPIITNYTPATSQIVHVSTLPAGRLVRIEYPDDGFNASVTAYVRDAHGNLISNRTYFSHYGMVVGVQYLGDPNGQNISVPSYAPGAQGG